MSNIVGIPLNFSCNYFLTSHVFININENQHKIICLLDHLVNMLCLPINLKTRFGTLGLLPTIGIFLLPVFILLNNS